MQNYCFMLKLMPDDTNQMSRAMENICCSKMLLNSFVSRLKADYSLEFSQIKFTNIQTPSTNEQKSNQEDFCLSIHHHHHYKVSSALRLIFSFSPLSLSGLAVSCLQPAKNLPEPKIGFQFKIFENCICISSNKSCLCRVLQQRAAPDIFRRI